MGRISDRNGGRSPPAMQQLPEGPDDREAMLREVDRLPEHYRLPILLHDLGGCSGREEHRTRKPE